MRKVYGVSLDQSLVDKFDVYRGDVSRSRAIERALELVLKMNKKEGC